MKKKIVNFTLILAIFLIVITFSCDILKDKTAVDDIVSKKYLETVENCPTNMDLNNDLSINIEDKKYLNNIINTETNPDLIFDFNKDNIVDINDATIYEKCYHEYFDCSFIISNNDLNIDNDKKIISRVVAGTKVLEFINDFTISSDSKVYMTDSIGNIKSDNEIVKTGDYVIIENKNKIQENYNISVIGDVLGTGVITIDSAKKIATHIVDQNVFFPNDNVVRLAADVNNDGKIKMNDVMKLVNGIETYE